MKNRCALQAWVGRAALLVGLILIGLPGPVLAAKVQLSFESALERMNQKNEALKAADAEKRGRAFEKKAAQGLYLPKISASGKYTRIDEPIDLSLNDIRGAMETLHGLPPGTLPDFIMNVQDDAFVKGRLTASWPVFTGGRITAANQVAEARETEAGEKMKQTRSVLVSDMVKRYYGLRLYDALLKLRRDYLEGVEKHLARARALEENGIISKAERLHAQVAVTEAGRELQNAIRDRETIRTALANVLSMDREEAEAVVASSPLFLIRNLPSLESFVALSDRENPILGQIRAKKAQAEKGVEYEKGFLFPEVYLFGLYELHKSDLTALEPEWAAGVGVNLPLFEGGSRMNTIKAAEETRRRVGFLEKKAARDIATLTEKQYHGVMKNLEQYDALGDTIELAREALRVRNRSFEEGLSTSLDVVDAHLTLSGARIRQLQAVYQFDVALAQLLEAVGISRDFSTYKSQYIAEEIF
ncbi:MAG: TolC family protein [Desulfobacterales bacterium]|nr:TolC family protein [Desulfobacterales bacterium]